MLLDIRGHDGGSSGSSSFIPGGGMSHWGTNAGMFSSSWAQTKNGLGYGSGGCGQSGTSVPPGGDGAPGRIVITEIY